MTNDEENELATLTINVVGDSDVDDEERQTLLQYLRAELNSLPFIDRADVAVATTPRTAGVKSGEVVTLGMLALAILPKAIPQLISFLKEWLARPNARPVKIRLRSGAEVVDAEYDPRTVTSDEIGRLIKQIKPSRIRSDHKGAVK